MDLLAAVALGVAVGVGVATVWRDRRDARTERDRWEAFQAAMRRRHP